MLQTPRIVVQALGAMFAVEGLIGAFSPEAFRNLVVWLQSPPTWPMSVVLRVFVGLLLLFVALPVRSAFAVRTVGAITLLGAVAGMLISDVQQFPHSIWRVPAIALLAAGCVVIWGSSKPSATS